jgi:Flp pilus assembly pilin Flp
MLQSLRNFYRDETGQDLIEYSLLITFIAIACAALVGSGRPVVNSIWTNGNSKLTDAADVARGGAS